MHFNYNTPSSQYALHTSVTVKKTEYMIIGSYKRISNTLNESTIKIEIGNHEINRTKSTKSLGVIINEHLV